MPMKIALCQINPVIGDLRGNGLLIADAAREARMKGADLAVFSEMCVTGYPPLDLLDYPGFLASVDRAVSSIASMVPSDIGILIGAPIRNNDAVGRRLFNAALLLEGGAVVDQIHKSLLPTYDVYDDRRYFEPSNNRRCMDWRGVRLGVHICEDMWNSDSSADLRMYDADPVAELAAGGADLFINLSATPFASGNQTRRSRIVERICRKYQRPFLLVNQVGANTELVFDGDSRAYFGDGRVAVAAPSFEEAVCIWDTGSSQTASIDIPDVAAVVHRALVLGMQDYMRKSGAFTRVVIGVSGGIDSAVTCAIAVEALGAENVVGVTMPSEFTAASSLEDARRLAQNLRIELHEIPISSAFDTVRDMLSGVFSGTQAGVAEENIQTRLRGVILMAMSNKYGYLLLATGNKSEIAVGYMTLYGDTGGCIGVLSDVFKTEVYELAHFINRQTGSRVIPQRIIDKPPSAELYPGQVDQDELPPYEKLDLILRLYIEDQLDMEPIVERTGFDRILVQDILRRVDASEFKRRQAPPGLRVSRKSFGTGRLMPVAMRWDHSSAPE